MAYRLTFTNFTRWHSTSVHWSDIRGNTFQLIKAPEDTYDCFFVLHRIYTHYYRHSPDTTTWTQSHTEKIEIIRLRFISHMYIYINPAVLCLLLSCGCQAQKGQSNNREKTEKHMWPADKTGLYEHSDLLPPARGGWLQAVANASSKWVLWLETTGGGWWWSMSHTMCLKGSTTMLTPSTQGCLS